MKREFILDGLGCANCASKIEARTNNLENIKSAAVNFAIKKLTVELDDNDEQLINKIQKIADSIEPGIKVVDKANYKGHIVSDVSCSSGACSVEHDHDHSHDHGHDHGHSHGNNQSNIKTTYLKFGISLVLFFSGLLLNLNPTVKLVIFLIAYFLIGWDVLVTAFKNILRGEVFDENFLMSIATIGAFLIGEYAEGVAVMIFYNIGEFFQDKAVDNSRKSIANLMDIRPDYANLISEDGTSKSVDPNTIKVGNKILVKPGEKIPLDGIIINGNSMIDTVALTGESVPKKVDTGDSVLSGSINKNGLLTIEVEKEFGDSTVSKILDLVENATGKKSKTEKFITKFSRYYTPIVVFAALIIAVIPPIVLGVGFSEWIRRALVFLVVSCPCALVISVPLGYFGGLGAASKKGILIKGGNYLEALTYVDKIVFDKTGTLTKGVFKVMNIKSFNGFSEDEVLKTAAFAESFSNHPIADSIKNAYGNPINQTEISDYKDIAGHGISAIINNKNVLVGNVKLMNSNNIKITDTSDFYGTIVHVAVDGKYAGIINISDEIKEDTKSAIKALKDSGINETIMLTGDNKVVANKVAEEIGISKVYSELLPNQKVEQVEKLLSSDEKKKVAFVGDGINDAPVLARADVGIAMGGLGSDAAIEAADVVLMTDEISKISTAIDISKYTQKIVIQNITFALGVKLLVLILSAFGYANMWLAVFADVGVALIAIFNSMRVLKFK